MRAGEQSLTPSLHKDATGISSQLKIYTEDACKMFYSHSKLNDCMRCAVGSLLTPLPAAGSLCDWTHVRSLDSSVVMSLLLLLPDHVGLCQRDYLLGWSLVTVKSGLCHCGCIPCWPSRNTSDANHTCKGTMFTAEGANKVWQEESPLTIYLLWIYCQQAHLTSSV